MSLPTALKSIHLHQRETSNTCDLATKYRNGKEKKNDEIEALSELLGKRHASYEQFENYEQTTSKIGNGAFGAVY